MAAQPVIRLAEALANLARPIQSGDVGLFDLFVVVVIAYAVYAS